jgi:ribA/ribD-fused uncharacterized protein
MHTIAAMTAEQPEPIKFYRQNDTWGEFSNFSPHPITLDEQRWATTEHYFQAQKFADPEHQAKIRAASDPGDAARLGRRLPGLRADWEQVKDEVMLTALRAKFTQHDRLGRMLLSTGSAVLIEHTKNDVYWADGGDGSGQNRLGVLLMQLREELRAAG